MALTNVPALSAPGDLDTGFGDSGRVLFDPYPGLERTLMVRSMTEQSDGRLVIAATSYDGPARILVLARFTEDGAIDQAFGNGGVVNGSLSDDFGAAVIHTSDGKIAVAGSTSEDIALWRFDSNGTADAGFGSGGLARHDFGGTEHSVGLVEQADGKLVVAATSDSGDNADIVLTRFSVDGTVDNTFGIAGAVRIAYPSSDLQEFATALAREPGGRLLVAGIRLDWDDFVATTVLARFDSTGQLDNTFGDDGLLELNFAVDESDSTEAGSLAIQQDGKIVVAGGIGSETGYWGMFPSRGFVARLQIDGTLDTGFGVGGVFETNSQGSGHFQTVLVAPDGTIAAGSSEYIWESDRYAGPYVAVARLNSDGTLDPAFGVAGTSTADFGDGDNGPSGYAAAIIRQDSGRLVLAGDQDGNMALAGFSGPDSAFPGFVGFSTGERHVDEDEGLIEINVRRTGGSTGTIGVTFETQDGSATAGNDYESRSTRLEWADGDASAKTIFVELRDDADKEVDEKFDLRLSDVSAGARLAASTATVWIRDNDLSFQPVPPQPIPPPSSGGGGSSDWLFLLLLATTLLHRPTTRDVHRR